MSAEFVHGEPLMVDFTPGTAIAANQVVVTADSVRIAHKPIAANTLGALAAVNGVYRATADGAIPTDTRVYWNASTSKLTLTAGNNKLIGVTLEASAADGNRILFRHDPVLGPRPTFLVSIGVPLAAIAAGDVMTEYTPGFAGRIVKFDAAVTTKATTASKLATLNLEVNTVDVTGGAVALTSSNCGTMGAVVAGSTITAGNTFGATDTISIEASSVTQFSEGQVSLLLQLERTSG
jgi:hypothetical protein